MLKKIFYLNSFLILLTIPLIVFAHPGRTDASGCHTNRKTGDYHCHNTPKTEVKEVRIEARTSAKTEARNDVSIPQEQTNSVNQEKLTVKEIIDGDTIHLSNGQKVRYIGVDTPETVHPSKPVQCFGKEASNKNKELVEGKEVRLEKDVSETDRYDRLLRYVYVGDIFINDYLVRNGYAYASSYPPDVKYQSLFLEAQKEARENQRGLWATCENNKK